ncbi:MATE family efflux transporter [uncultured Cloacibacillus sp.]|uniref:MATE family efflux transporter n=1 Tax=uncultured Cloacibacillus sp. TaxID=889794 RepID=UPI0025D06161|nr:MATE family efflux transporter [uncultured Cloacibacillus sp.]
MKTVSEKELFEEMPVPKAVAALAVPTIISQIVSMIYNLADTFFIGQLGAPYMVAAITLVYPWFSLLTALGNLFGIGGSSLVSRFLGLHREGDARRVSSFCFYGGIAATLAFSLLSFAFMKPILLFLGASAENYGYASSYFLWVVVIGGVPTMTTLTMAHLLRGEGHARLASAGMMAGGFLNMALDPLLIFGAGMDVSGAAIATAFSNLASMIFFACVFHKIRKNSALSLNPALFTVRYTGPVLSVGLAAAMAITLANLSAMTIVKLSSGYGDVAVAAYGIVKKIDQLPLCVSTGLYQGFMPLVSYNYAAKNYKRMKDVAVFSWKTSIVITALFVVCFATFSREILGEFIDDAQTAALGSSFLRIACLAVPLTGVNAQISYTLQAMGRGLGSAALITCRQGFLNIPILCLMNRFAGLYGMIWTQLIVEVIMFPISLLMYAAELRRIRREEGAERAA